MEIIHSETVPALNHVDDVLNNLSSKILELMVLLLLKLN